MNKKKLFFRLALLILILLSVNKFFFSYPDIITSSPEEAITALDQLGPRTERLAHKFLEQCANEGLPVRIIETYRTKERQEYLYSLGRDIPGDVVTWTKNSKHTKRRAFDIVKDIPGQYYSDDNFFKRCAEIGESIGLEAGYYWSVQDSGHFENNGLIK